MTDVEIRVQLLVAAQRALLGAIYPDIRAIAVGFDGLRKLTIKMYLDRPPTESDYDELSAISGEILGDIDFASVEEICEYNVDPKYQLDGLDRFVYSRKEY